VRSRRAPPEARRALGDSDVLLANRVERPFEPQVVEDVVELVARIAAKTVSAARAAARAADNGYSAIATPASRSSSSESKGVSPNSVMFASTGTSTAAVNARSSSALSGASAKITSAPAFA
jgi:hypothetical protein